MTEQTELRLGNRNPATGGVILFSMPAAEFTRRVRNAFAGTPEPVVHYLPDAGPDEMARSAMLNPDTGEVYRTKAIREDIANQLDMRFIPEITSSDPISYVEGGLSDDNDSMWLSQQIDRVATRRSLLR